MKRNESALLRQPQPNFQKSQVEISRVDKKSRICTKKNTDLVTPLHVKLSDSKDALFKLLLSYT